MTSESTFEIEHRELDSMLIAGVKITGRYSDMGKGFGKLGRAIGRYISGPGMCLYHDEEHRDEDANFEPFFPIKKEVSVEGISVRELPGGKAICLKHKGPYEELESSYAKLSAYATENGLTRVIPSREVYLKGPGMLFKGNPKKYLTEIQFIVSNSEGDASV